MRTSVGVIGNSHLGAVKIAWDEMGKDYPGVSFEFFGSRSHLLTRTYMDGPVLKTRSRIVRDSLLKSGGAEEVDLRRYDLIWLVGAGVNLRTLAFMVKDKRLHPHGDGVLDNLRNGRAKPFSRRSEFVSRALIKQAFRERLARSVAGDLVAKFRPETKADIHLVHEPHLDEHAIEDKELAYMRIVLRSGMADDVATIFEECFREEFKGLAGLISQPRDTVVESMFTSQAYSTAGVGLANMAKGPSSATARDNTHKNAAYGKRIVELFMAGAGLARREI